MHYWNKTLVFDPLFFCLRLVKDVPVVAVVTEEAKEQLVEASAVTKKAYTTYRREAEAEEHQAAADGSPVPMADKSQDEGEMSVIITIMQPILRLMQLLCENHNRDLQVRLLTVPSLTTWHVDTSWPTFWISIITLSYTEMKPCWK